MGNIYAQLREYDKAIDSYLSARELLCDLDNHFIIAKCDLNLAQNYLLGNNTDIAYQFIQSARKTFEVLKNEIELADCFFWEAKIATKYLQYDEALNLLELANNKYQEHKLYIKSANCYLELAIIYTIFGDFINALKFNDLAKSILLNQTITEFNLVEMETANLSCDINNANIQYYSGKYKQSIHLYKTIHLKYKKYISLEQNLNLDFNISCAYMFLKKYDIALEKFITLQKAYYKNGHKADLELCDLNIATAEYFLGNYKNAYFQYRKGIR